MRMTESEFEREKRYQGLMYFIKKMLCEGLLSEEEYRALCTEYAAELSPKTGTLLSENDLLCVQKRVMNGVGKEAESLENKED